MISGTRDILGFLQLMVLNGFLNLCQLIEASLVISHWPLIDEESSVFEVLTVLIK